MKRMAYYGLANMARNMTRVVMVAMFGLTMSALLWSNTMASIDGGGVGDIAQEQAHLLSACPAQWESLESQLDFSAKAEGDLEGNLWSSEADYAAWRTYFSGLPDNETITDSELERVGNDRLTIASDCAAQRVKVMLMLGGTPLGDAAVALLSQIHGVSDEAIEGVTIVGSRADFPARSCLHINENHPDAQSGYYWIKLGISAQLHHVFCEMEHDGGGWTYWGFIGSNASPRDIFGSDDSLGSGVNCDARNPEVAIAPRSCRQVLESGNANGDGIYQLDLHGTGSTEPVWCDMSHDGGGWTYLSHKNVGTLSTSQASAGHIASVYYSGNAGQPTASEDQDWYGTYKKCNSGDNCVATSNVDWANPIGANELRLMGAVSGDGQLSVNGTPIISVQDDNIEGCATTTTNATAYPISGALQIKAKASVYGGCGGIAKVSQIAVREPSGLCGLPNDTAYEPPIVEVDSDRITNADYDKYRRQPTDATAVQSAFALNQFGDTEMIFSLDSPSIESAQAMNKYMHYRYDYDSAVFNLGPLPCHLGGYEYSQDGTNFSVGSVGSCTADSASLQGEDDDLLMIIRDNQGIYWGEGMGGNNSWNHPTWIYVR